MSGLPEETVASVRSSAYAGQWVAVTQDDADPDSFGVGASADWKTDGSYDCTHMTFEDVVRLRDSLTAFIRSEKRRIARGRA